MNYRNDWLNACFNTKAPKQEDLITVIFKNGTQADYTKNILNLLKSDKSVKDIMDKETGEIIYSYND